MHSSPVDSRLLHDCQRELLGEALRKLFRPLAPDDAQATWLAHYRARPHGFVLSKLADLLSGYATSYDVHGFLGAYQMHLLSSQSWGDLLGEKRVASLLDVGAGAGYVTEHARAWAERIVCTETSAPLRKRLAARGFEVLDSDLTDSTLEHTFDVVSCFNVLDRTPRPLSLLAQLGKHVAPAGKLLVSIPLPPAPHVHVRGGTISPRERLPSTERDWESSARELSERLFEPVLAPLGLGLARLCRVPYLSRGDREADLYVLDDALWLFQR